MTTSAEDAALPFLTESSGWVNDGAEDPALAPSPPVNEAGSRRVQGHILLADDNADMRDYLKDLLRAEGWSVAAVPDGAAALASLADGLPDLVISDVMMPGLDGLELLAALQENERTRAIPVILVSARAGASAAAEAMNRGAADYLIKPFSSRDLIARVAARLEVAHARAEVTRANERLKQQLMQAPVAVSVVAGPDFVYELANPLYLEMTGREADIVGKTLSEAFPEIGSDSEVLRMLEGVYRSGELFHAEEYLVPLDRGRGRIEDAYFKFTCQPIRDERGAVTRIMSVAVDVTPQVSARHRILALMEELKLADRRKDEFLAMLAHELRNPLAAISMALALLERGAVDEERASRLKATARRQMNNLVRLVDDLLDVSRITRGNVELRREHDVDLRDIVRSAVSAMRPVIDERRHQLEVNYERGPFLLEGDATRLEQMVVNLLTNATKYTEPGGHLVVNLYKERSLTPVAVLKVRDDGRGIPSEMLERVFDTFVQVDPSIDRRTGGLGLGLTLVRRLVELHGGSVEIHSGGVGAGSEVVVRLPLSAEKRRRAKASRSSQQRRRGRPSRRRILIVEDSDDVRETMREYLEQLGHEVFVADDGSDGVSRALALAPDIAFVDVGLPQLDGYEVARRVRAASGAEIYLVALTGYGEPDAKTASSLAGFDLHLTKPVEVRELDRVLEEPRSGRSRK